MRLNRYLAQCGLGSRRAVENLIVQGRVRVNGVTARDLSTQVEAGRDRVEADGAKALPPSGLEYLMLNKPEGYDVTRRDPHARRTVFDLLPPDLSGAVQPVGRLDRDTMGLIILTSDGDLSHRLAHPRREIEKEYEILGTTPPTRQQLEMLTRGVELEDGPARALRAEALDVGRSGPHQGIKLVTHVGRKRIVRRMAKAIDYELTGLRRVRIGPLALGNLALGKSRPLTPEEVAALKIAAGIPVAEIE